MSDRFDSAEGSRSPAAVKSRPANPHGRLPAISVLILNVRQCSPMRAVLIFFRAALSAYVIFLIAVYFLQRSLIYLPSHEERTGSLLPWKANGQIIGYCRELASPGSV